jgi:putative tryptophan/tyrosine transport system substrate-binding protein
MNHRRRSLLLAFASAAALARAQESAVPVIGFLNGAAPGPWVYALAGFRKGLGEEGFVEGRNVAVEYRWADNHDERLPALAQELVRRQVQVLVSAGGDPATIAAKAATSTILIVFSLTGDPVGRGFVASLNRPGGNLTGMSWFLGMFGPKRLELLHQLVRLRPTSRISTRPPRTCRPT